MRRLRPCVGSVGLCVDSCEAVALRCVTVNRVLENTEQQCKVVGKVRSVLGARGSGYRDRAGGSLPSSPLCSCSCGGSSSTSSSVCCTRTCCSLPRLPSPSSLPPPPSVLACRCRMPPSPGLPPPPPSACSSVDCRSRPRVSYGSRNAQRAAPPHSPPSSVTQACVCPPATRATCQMRGANRT